jgi:hypothetical protein
MILALSARKGTHVATSDIILKKCWKQDDYKKVLKKSLKTTSDYCDTVIEDFSFLAIIDLKNQFIVFQTSDIYCANMLYRQFARLNSLCNKNRFSVLQLGYNAENTFMSTKIRVANLSSEIDELNDLLFDNEDFSKIRKRGTYNKEKRKKIDSFLEERRLKQHSVHDYSYDSLNN